MMLTFIIHGYRNVPIKTVNYGLGTAVLYKAYHVWSGPDDADLDKLSGTCVSDLEDELYRLGFVEVIDA